LKSDITCILNGYKRPENLNLIYEALNNQTVKPKEIRLWYNLPEDDTSVNYDLLHDLNGIMSFKNLGCWARFAFALLADTEYICIFDDDTVPGKRWLENCLNTINTYNGLLGTVGLIYGNKYSYFEGTTRHGWPNPNEGTLEVDIVGHSWFFRRDWLHYLFIEKSHSWNVGEDIHFSYMLQKYAGIKTFVPPHPKDNKEMWGSINGYKLGSGKEAMGQNYELTSKMDYYFKLTVNNGWGLICDRL